MRRSWTLKAGLSLLLLFVPIYLWKIQGWFDKTTATVPATSPDLGTEVAKGVDTDNIEDLAKKNQVELLRQCLLRYKNAPVKGYTCTLVKQERINGKLRKPETIECWFQEKPYSVLMHWKEGAGIASASMYVADENDGKMCVRPAGALSVVVGVAKRAPDCSDAKDTSRYLITEFGIRCGAERTYTAWKALEDGGKKLDTEYLGRQIVKEAGDRPCHVLKRRCNPPEEDGMTEITIYIDEETWFQVGTVLKQNDALIGSYFFKDINVNPEFKSDQFKIETLKKF